MQLADKLLVAHGPMLSVKRLHTDPVSLWLPMQIIAQVRGLRIHCQIFQVQKHKTQ
jgi:hypothetical protein